MRIIVTQPKRTELDEEKFRSSVKELWSLLSRYPRLKEEEYFLVPANVAYDYFPGYYRRGIFNKFGFDHITIANYICRRGVTERTRLYQIRDENHLLSCLQRRIKYRSKRFVGSTGIDEVNQELDNLIFEIRNFSRAYGFFSTREEISKYLLDLYPILDSYRTRFQEKISEGIPLFQLVYYPIYFRLRVNPTGFEHLPKYSAYFSYDERSFRVFFKLRHLHLYGTLFLSEDELKSAINNQNLSASNLLETLSRMFLTTEILQQMVDVYEEMENYIVWKKFMLDSSYGVPIRLGGRR